MRPNTASVEPEEFTFINWYVETTGHISRYIDALGQSEFTFFWQCGPGAELNLQYSEDAENWDTQMSLSPEQCAEGGFQHFETLGRYYRVEVGPIVGDSLFVFAQGRFGQ
jgi:hypothetical protein